MADDVASQILFDSSEPPWWLNGHEPPADWTVVGQLRFQGPNGEWVTIDFDNGCSAAEVVLLLTHADA